MEEIEATLSLCDTQLDCISDVIYNRSNCKFENDNRIKLNNNKKTKNIQTNFIYDNKYFSKLILYLYFILSISLIIYIGLYIIKISRLYLPYKFELIDIKNYFFNSTNFKVYFISNLIYKISSDICNFFLHIINYKIIFITNIITLFLIFL